MSFYDIVMLVVLFGAIIFGYLRGFAWQIASVSAIVVSYVVAVNFREQVAQMIQLQDPLDKIAAMLILFVGSSLAIWIVYAWVTKSMEAMELKGFDRQIGALVGGVTGALICMAITMFSVSLMGDKAHEAIHDSKLGPYVVQGIQKLHGILPEEIAARFDDYVKHFEGGIGQPAYDIPTSYNPFPERQADGTAAYQGGWPSNNASVRFHNNGQTQNQNLSDNNTPSGNPNTSRFPVSVDFQPQPTTSENGWRAPKVQIKIDSESLFNNVLGNDQ